MWRLQETNLKKITSILIVIFTTVFPVQNIFERPKQCIFIVTEVSQT